MKDMTRVLALLACLFPLALQAGPQAFKPGDLVKDHGLIAEVPGAVPIPDGASFKVAFDLAKAASEGSVNSQVNSAARFLNMHHAAGIPAKNLQLALIVHGSAYRDLLNDEAYGSFNPNAELIEQLVEKGVIIHLCGQTAAYYDIGAENLLPGVELSLSAMTSHALLQQQGYTLNPF